MKREEMVSGLLDPFHWHSWYLSVYLFEWSNSNISGVSYMTNVSSTFHWHSRHFFFFFFFSFGQVHICIFEYATKIASQHDSPIMCESCVEPHRAQNYTMYLYRITYYFWNQTPCIKFHDVFEITNYVKIIKFNIRLRPEKGQISAVSTGWTWP